MLAWETVSKFVSANKRKGLALNMRDAQIYKLKQELVSTKDAAAKAMFSKPTASHMPHSTGTLYFLVYFPSLSFCSCCIMFYV
jgi:hypothetical protein